MPSNLTKAENQRDPYAQQRVGPSELMKLWAKYKPSVIEYVNDLNSRAGAHRKLLRDAASETTQGKYGPATAQALADVAEGYDPSFMGVIKKVGGNWLAGSAEKALERLKSAPTSNVPAVIKAIEDELENAVATGNTEAVAVFQDMLGRQRPKAAMDSWIDKTLTKYVKNEMASPKDPVRLTADAWPAKKAQMLAEAQAKIDALAAKITVTAREKGVPEHYLTEMRQQMIPLEKARDLIAERGGMHYEPVAQPYGPGEMTALRRTRQGFPAEGLAKASQAQSWESLSDRAVQMLEPKVLTTGSGSTRTLRENPWVAKLGPEDRVANMHADLDTSRDLGFDHLMDELRNAVNPNSGLPKELLWKYEDLAKKTVPDAVEHVDKINAWRAVNTAELNQARANNPATHLFKEYPDKGFKWVELKQPTATGRSVTVQKRPDAIQGVDTEEDILEYARDLAEVDGFVPGTQAYDDYVATTVREFTPVDVDVDEGYKHLQDALKYEGDTMKHCVGGYCDDVADGSTKIYSLRDVKGKPHATVEVVPKAGNIPITDQMRAERSYLRAWDTHFNPETGRSATEYIPPSLSINQIKGFKNKKPNDEVIPYIQDFVKSGQWSGVGDLQNTGLRQHGGGYFSDQELIDKINSFGREKATPENLDELLKYYGPAGFAEGGIVSNGYDSQRVNDLVAALEQELYA